MRTDVRLSADRLRATLRCSQPIAFRWFPSLSSRSLGTTMAPYSIRPPQQPGTVAADPQRTRVGAGGGPTP